MFTLKGKILQTDIHLLLKVLSNEACVSWCDRFI